MVGGNGGSKYIFVYTFIVTKKWGAVGLWEFRENIQDLCDLFLVISLMRKAVETKRFRLQILHFIILSKNKT